jgi:uncharacterized protein
VRLLLLPGRYTICHVASLPGPQGDFFCVVKTPDELSLICEEPFAPPHARCETGWRVLRFEGTFAFTEVGVLASVLDPLREAGVPILAVSTFDTDYVLVKHSDLEATSQALNASGILVAEV